MKAIWLVVSALLVTACTPSIIHGNAEGGLVGIGGALRGQSKAMALADAYCAKFGKAAVYQGTNEIRETVRFSCAPMSGENK